MSGYISEKMWESPRGQFQYERDLLYRDPKTAESTGKLIKPVTKEKLTNRTRKRDQTRVGQFQTTGKKSLLTSQPTKSKGYIQTTKTTSTTSKGGGKSAGGGGGKLSIINRALGGRSPWHLLRRLLE